MILLCQWRRHPKEGFKKSIFSQCGIAPEFCIVYPSALQHVFTGRFFSIGRREKHVLSIGGFARVLKQSRGMTRGGGTRVPFYARQAETRGI